MALAALRDLERSYLDLRWHFDPVAATQAGITTYDDRYGEYTTASLAAHLAALKALSAALEEAPVDGLEGEIDRTALLNEIRVTIQRFENERPQTHNPEFWLAHLTTGLHHLLARGERDRSAAARAAAIAGRLAAVPGLLADAKAALEVPVAIFAQSGLGMAQGAIALIREIAATSPDLGEVAEAAITALTGFLDDLRKWSDSGSEQFAIDEDGFNFRLHYEHALRDTAPELWRYGHRLKEEVLADLAERAKRLDRRRPWPEVAERLRADHPAANDLVERYRAEMERARRFVAERSLAAIPDAPLRVVPTPGFMRPVVPFAAYDSPGAYSADRTGWFYVTLPDPALAPAHQERLLRDHCRYELAATALHEGYPGHHLQMVTAQTLASETRKCVWTPLTVEGWALYCEDMMAEEGFYDSEEERFFQRIHLLWRALRVLLDVGLQTRGMTFTQAVDSMVQELHIDRVNAEAEVRSYCANPVYPLCYAVGRRELLQLREDFRSARGTTFSLRAFHDAVLGYGGLPVALIRWGLGLGE